VGTNGILECKILSENEHCADPQSPTPTVLEETTAFAAFTTFAAAIAAAAARTSSAAAVQDFSERQTMTTFAPNFAYLW
jgi:hypothetical protein